MLDEVDSTLNEARRIAPTLAGPEWILAYRQSGGRGRRGRAWTDTRGNFAGTLVLRPDEPLNRAALRSFVAALALHDACVAVTGRAEGLTLKWPNDVLLNGGKLAGILLESSGHGTGVNYLAIGVGVNLADAPSADALEPQAVAAVSLRGETGIEIDPDSFLTHLAKAYAARERDFVTYGFAPIRAAWLARAARLGQEIVARTATGETRGRFETVDGEGGLVLDTAQGRAVIQAADIYF